MKEYIDRGDLIKFLDNLQQPKFPITKGFTDITITDAIKVVSERPIADVKPIVHAHWIDKEKIMFPICSKCGLTSVEKYSFCPNCGAKMC